MVALRGARARERPSAQTLIIDDDVAAAARHRAVSDGITLSALVTRALRVALQEGIVAPDPPFSMVTWGASGPPMHRTPGELAAVLEQEDIDALAR